MRKLVFLCRRRPDITHAEYAKLLVDGHIPMDMARFLGPMEAWFATEHVAKLPDGGGGP
jgi:hypothetical protein